MSCYLVKVRKAQVTIKLNQTISNRQFLKKTIDVCYQIQTQDYFKMFIITVQVGNSEANFHGYYYMLFFMMALWIIQIKMRGYVKLVFAMSYVGNLNIQYRKGHL